MSTDRRILVIDNLGATPCIPPTLLGRLLDRLDDENRPTLRERIKAALVVLKQRLAR